MSRAAPPPLTVTEALLGRMVAENHALREQNASHATEIAQIRAELDQIRQAPAEDGGGQ